MTERAGENCEVPPAPDGGYGWVITFIAFYHSMVCNGILYTSGLLFDTFVEVTININVHVNCLNVLNLISKEFEAQYRDVALVFAIELGFLNTITPLTRKFDRSNMGIVNPATHWIVSNLIPSKELFLSLKKEGKNIHVAHVTKLLKCSGQQIWMQEGCLPWWTSSRD